MAIALNLDALLTQAEGMDFLDRQSDDDADKVALLINDASARIARYCARNLVERIYDSGANNLPKLRLSGSGTPYLTLPQWPVSALTSAIAYYMDGGNTSRSLNFTNAYVNALGVAYLPLDVWDKGWNNIELVCTAGYNLTTHPNERAILRRACKRLIQVMWQDQNEGTGRATSINLGSASLSLLDQAFPADVVQMLQPFQRTY